MMSDATMFQATITSEGECLYSRTYSRLSSAWLALAALATPDDGRETLASTDCRVRALGGLTGDVRSSGQCNHASLHVLRYSVRTVEVSPLGNIVDALT